MPKIILASSSVQRKRLLEEAGFSFEVIVSNVDETPVEAYSFNDQFTDISMRKAVAVIDMVSSDEDYIIVAADQNIFFNGKWNYCETFKLEFDDNNNLVNIENIK